MNIIILGAGMQGSACAYDLATSEGIEKIALFDQDLHLAQTSAHHIETLTRTKIESGQIDVINHTQLVSTLTPYDVVISAVPYFLNPAITKAAIEAKTHMVDMGGNTDLVFEQRRYNKAAIDNDVTILPDCGLAPGMANIIAAEGIRQFDSVDSVKIRVGGLPKYPVPPLNYQLFFSVHGLINEYIGDAIILRHGKPVSIPTLSELENISFDGFEQPLEAAITLGGLSTLPWTYEGKVQSLDYKTLRYPNHWHVIASMRQLGLFDTEPIVINNTSVTPRALTAEQMSQALDWETQGGQPEDVVLVKIIITGTKNNTLSTQEFELIDHYDPKTKLTAMMRCTAFPVSIVAQMLGNQSIRNRGVLTLEETVSGEAFITELKKRNLQLSQKTTS